ncbi:MAG: hypothetical protein E6G34_02240 [Actinobacteria bacterium]|nr:MAG: hypothetical protein E6G34_02240 [Actinomycetota bacterium]
MVAVFLTDGAGRLTGHRCFVLLRRATGRATSAGALIGDDYTVTGELAEPFDVILGEELRRAAIARESEVLKEVVDEALRERAIDSEGDTDEQRPRKPERALVGAGTASGPSWSNGLSRNNLVRPSGLEPPPGILRTRPST